MKKVALVLAVSLFGGVSFASGKYHPSQNACLEQFQVRVDKKIALGVPAKHLPRLYIPKQNPQRTVVVFTHGIFESPYFFKGLNHIFEEQGFITLSILLPGHWEGNWSSMRKVHYKEWIAEVSENVRIARCLGDKIIFAGHSLGGILSIHAALKYRDLTAGLMLWSPAVEMRTLPTLGGVLGNILNVDGNIVLKPADTDEQALISPNAANQVHNMISHVRKTYGNGKMKNVYPYLEAPTFFAYAARDPAINVDELTLAAHTIKGLNPLDVMFFPTKTGAWHGNIAKSETDSYKRKKLDYNPRWVPMKRQIESFLRKNF